MRKTFDFVVAGAGVVGVHVARCLLLQHPACSIALVDRAFAAGSQASSTNSGVLHAGVYYGSDSHKAAFCVRGNASTHRKDARCPANDCASCDNTKI
jgi:L-2-hydroxyglutarate oxidase